MYQDKTLTCRECGQEFTFTASEQVPFQPRGDRPVYCRDCFAKNRPQY